MAQVSTTWDTLVEPEGEAQGFTDGQLLEDWIAPPFSVLDTRQGYWKERRERWLSLGIQSELGRGEDLLNLEGARVRQDAYKAAMNTPGRVGEGGMATALARSLEKNSGNYRSDYGVYSPGKAARREADERSNVTGAASLPAYADFGTALVAPGTSIFDPVLCELVYRWWCPAGGHVLDPFAGGSVRGITAALLGHPYTGVDLSARQVEANREQAARIVPAHKPMPEWVVGDSRQLATLLPAGQAFDLVFTCPPYYDLEVYSDDPSDLSAAPSYAQFLQAYQDVLAAAGARLLSGRFAVVVVSEIRDKRGVYRGLVPDTVASLEHAGLQFYNEAILLNPVGSLAMRAGKAMRTSRKLGRTHQNVIVALRGDPDDIRTWDAEREAPPEPQQALWALDEAEATPVVTGNAEATAAAEVPPSAAADTTATGQASEAAARSLEPVLSPEAESSRSAEVAEVATTELPLITMALVDPPPPWEYQLTADDEAELEPEVTRVAANYERGSDEQGRPCSMKFVPEGWTIPGVVRFGFRAELACARLLGQPWNRGQRDLPDVGDHVQVRTTTEQPHALRVYDYDSEEHLYVLVVLEASRWRAFGWARASEVRAQGTARSSGYKAHQLASGHLHQMRDLPDACSVCLGPPGLCGGHEFRTPAQLLAEAGVEVPA